MNDDVIQWLLNSAEPWTRYRTMVDLLGRPETDAEAQAARAEMLIHPQTEALVARAAAWGDRPLKRHNDAGHPLYALSTLADFGIQAADPGMSAIMDRVLAHQSAEGAFQTLVNVPQSFGGSGADAWAWMACDAPTLLYVLAALGMKNDERVRRAAAHLTSLIEENGWRCKVAPELGRFRGPGRKDDPCPIANVYALKALSLLPEWADSPAARAGAEVLLWHWAHRREVKPYLFGMGSDFHKIKYPFVWYDILHVVEVLSRFPWVHADGRFQEMVQTLAAQAEEACPERQPEVASRRDCRYTAGSMYQSWKGWSFTDKKQPSPWLTFLVLHIQKRLLAFSPKSL